MGTMHVLGPEGDIKVEWDPADDQSVSKAKEEWDRLKNDGYEMYESVEAKGKRLTRFNKRLGKVLAAPGVQTKADKQAGKREEAMAGGPRERLVAV